MTADIYMFFILKVLFVADFVETARNFFFYLIIWIDSVTIFDDRYHFFCVLGEEALGQCLLSATKLALVGEIKIFAYSFLFDLFISPIGIADQDECCKKFMEVLIPEAFKKVRCFSLFDFHLISSLNSSYNVRIM